MNTTILTFSRTSDYRTFWLGRIRNYFCKYLKITYLILLIVFSNELFAQTQNLGWARETLGTGLESGVAITTDASGNVYATGYFEGTVDFDPGAGVTYMTSVGLEDIFITKSDAAGNLIWVKTAGGTGDDEGSTIAVDASGNVFIGGSFEGVADLDPGAGVVNITRVFTYMAAVFVLKLNSAGTFQWVKPFGGNTASLRLNKIILDASGNPIMGGAFVYGPQDFDPNAGTANLTGIYQDAVFFKLTTAGIYVWAKQITGVNSLDYSEIYDMELDPSGNIIIVGIVHGTFDFNPGAGTANITTMGFGDSFVGKYTSAGVYIWAGITGGTSASTTVWNSEVAIDATGAIYVTNYCNTGPIDFDITAAVFNVAVSGSKTSIQKLNSSGNLIWVKLLNTTSWSVPICVGANGLYLSSYFSGTVDFNPGAGIFNLTSNTSPFPLYINDIYQLHLDTAGNFISALKYGGRFNDYVEDMWLDASDNLYTTGFYSGEGDFDPGAGVTNLYSNGATEFFMHKISGSAVFAWAKGFGSETYEFVNAISNSVGTYVTSTGYFDGSTSSTSGNFLRNKGSFDIMVNKVSTAGNSFDIWYGMGGPGSDAGTGVITDASNNTYVTGYFEQTSDFAPRRNSPSYLMTSAGNRDIFILKIDIAGNLIWAKRIGGTSNDESTAISLDNVGNLYVSGFFQGTVDFNPGAGISNLTSAGSLDAFALKMDTAGNFIWAKNFGGTNSDLANNITTDALGNVITCGSFNGTADFNPAAAVANLVSNGSIDAFIVKLNSTGNYVWAKSVGGTGNEYAQQITTDASNNVICAGSYGSSTDFDPNAGTATMAPPNALGEIFLLQLSPIGNFSWSKSMGGAGADRVKGLTMDAIGNIYTSGSFNGTADLNPSATGTFNATSNGSDDVFINCYRPASDVSWTKTFGGTTFDQAAGIAVDNAYKVYAIGNFSGTVDFDPNAGTFALTAMGGNGLFAIQLTQSSPLPIELVSFEAKAIDGKEVLCRWTTATEINNDYFTIERSADGYEFEEAGRVEGAGNSTASLDYTFVDKYPYRGKSYYRLKQTDFDGAFSYSKIIAVNISGEKKINVYPRVSSESVNIQSPESMVNSTVMVTNMQGEILQQVYIGDDEMNVKINLSGLSNGMYFVRIVHDGETEVFKVIKI